MMQLFLCLVNAKKCYVLTFLLLTDIRTKTRHNNEAHDIR